MHSRNPYIPHQMNELFGATLQNTVFHYQEVLLALDKVHPKSRRMKRQIEGAVAAIREELAQREHHSPSR